MHLARQGIVSPAMRRVSEREDLPAETIRGRGRARADDHPANVYHRALDPMAIGLKAQVKINANTARDMEQLLAREWDDDARRR